MYDGYIVHNEKKAAPYGNYRHQSIHLPIDHSLTLLMPDITLTYTLDTDSSQARG